MARVRSRNEQIVEAVAKGAAWLDEVHPRWASLIDISKLSMDDCPMCVLGQSRPFGGGFYTNCEDKRAGWAEQHGFTLVFADEGAWDYLRDLWAMEVRARL